MIERTDKCPTCGSLVRIVSADDDLGGDIVTSHYEPIQDEELQQKIKQLMDENKKLVEYNSSLAMRLDKPWAWRPHYGE